MKIKMDTYAIIGYIIIIIALFSAMLLSGCSSAPVVVGGMSEVRNTAVDAKLDKAPDLIRSLEYDGIDSLAFKDPAKSTERRAISVKLSDTIETAKTEITALREEKNKCETNLAKEILSNTNLKTGIGSSHIYRNMLIFIFGFSALLLFLKFGLSALISGVKSIIGVKS
jgi:PBP1b-binding outer membrane lipoprotein LpoB